MRRVLRWFQVQLLTMALSTAITASWIVLALSAISNPPGLYSSILMLIFSALLPLLSFLEAVGRKVFRREYRMDVASCLMVSALFIVAPVVLLYLFIVGECLKCGQTYWDVAFASLTVAIPAALAQNISYRAALFLLPRPVEC